MKVIDDEEKYRTTKIKVARWIFSIALIVTIYMVYWICFDENPFLKSGSPDRINLVEITEYGNGFLFGPKNIKIYFKGNEGTILEEKKVRISNIMEPNNKSLYDITWEDKNQVEITMNYEDETKVLNYNFKTREMDMNIK
ncbi:hypothetical protein SFC65_19605 [Priestia filamentosa]|uniref:hypothetical protein n=1 Tax=Priestia filamentosa TaxID=1402861 RepID=UPI003981B095